MSFAALLVLTLPHSNADDERVFSLIKKNKTEFRESLCSIITVKMNFDGESHQFRPSTSLTKKSKSSSGEYNRLHKKTTALSGDTDSHHQPEENAPAILPNRNRRGSQGKNSKIDNKQEGKTSVSSKNLKQPTVLNFQRKVVWYKAVQIPKELGEVFLQFSRDNTLNNTETCGVLGGMMLVHSLW